MFIKTLMVAERTSDVKPLMVATRALSALCLFPMVAKRYAMAAKHRSAAECEAIVQRWPSPMARWRQTALIGPRRRTPRVHPMAMRHAWGTARGSTSFRGDVHRACIPWPYGTPGTLRVTSFLEEPAEVFPYRHSTACAITRCLWVFPHPRVSSIQRRGRLRRTDGIPSGCWGRQPCKKQSAMQQLIPETSATPTRGATC